MPRGTDNRSPVPYRTLLSVWLVLCSGSGVAAQTSVPTSCYDLHLEAWDPTVDLRSDSLYVALPPRIQLDSTPGADVFGRDDRYRLEPAPGVIGSVHRFSWWEEVGDSTRMIWTNGFSGVSVSVEPADGDFVGTARTFWDFDQPVQTAAARAVPVACDAPVPEEWLPRHRFPASIALARGDSIRLGSDMPLGIETAHKTRNTWDLVAPDLAHPLDVAHEVQLSTDSLGRVSKVWVYFQGDIDFPTLETQLRELWGDPTTASERESPQGDAERMILWHDRYVSLSLRKSVASDGTVFIVAFLTNE